MKRVALWVDELRCAIEGWVGWVEGPEERVATTPALALFGLLLGGVVGPGAVVAGEDGGWGWVARGVFGEGDGLPVVGLG